MCMLHSPLHRSYLKLLFFSFRKVHPKDVEIGLQPSPITNGKPVDATKSPDKTIIANGNSAPSQNGAVTSQNGISASVSNTTKNANGPSEASST